MNIKETLEVYDAADQAFDGLLAATADGRLNWLDAQHVLEPIRAAAKAAQGANLIPAEIKDVDQEELIVLVQRTQVTIQKAMKAFESLGTLKA